MPHREDPGLNQLLKLAAEWVTAQEAAICREGRPLSSRHLKHAQQIGILHPARVRLQAVENIPLPEHPALRQAMEAGAMPVEEGKGSGLCLRYGIYVSRDRAADANLIVHELVHTRQYEQAGGIEPFLREYMAQVAGGNYFNAPFELEARKLAAELCPNR